MPEQHKDNISKTAIITGATSGLGYETALKLAGQGWSVILTGRNDTKGQQALDLIRAQIPGARIDYQHLDLSSLDSVADFAAQIGHQVEAIDLLVNNAGVMSPPQRKLTRDGFELQLGTNYLGHFALTARLLPLLQNAPAPRVVNVSSISHRHGQIHFEDLNWERRYKPFPAYAQSKLAMLIFAIELQRRSDTNNWGLLSTAAHPGIAETPLFYSGPGNTGLLTRLTQWAIPFISHSAAAGAEPILLAGLSDDAKPGGYYGPQGFQEIKGKAGTAVISRNAQDLVTAQRLWEVSEQLTGIKWPENSEN
jgi:NAD(P)-dependent dehydrogenase (short-subunit alcohol dehydrogenase family)